jgi:hypothetical protein
MKPAAASDAAPPAPSFKHGRVPGNAGIWVGIFCVLVEFLLLFGVYFIAIARPFSPGRTSWSPPPASRSRCCC